MQSFQPSFDADTLALMGRAFDDAWWHLLARKCLPCADEGAARSVMACAIMAAVVNGERDPERLKAADVRPLMGRTFHRGHMSALGQKRTSRSSAMHVCYGPEAAVVVA
jgi:hypothetical protein